MKSLLIKQKLLKLQKKIFENVRNLGMFLIEEAVDKKFSDEMKASEGIEEVFVSDNCGKNFKTTLGFKDPCDQSL